MRTFYFIGGPKRDKILEFFNRLESVGGKPPTWKVYPHSANDGRALHIIKANSKQEILDHLNNFSDIYEHDEIIEVTETN